MWLSRPYAFGAGGRTGAHSRASWRDSLFGRMIGKRGRCVLTSPRASSASPRSAARCRCAGARPNGFDRGSALKPTPHRRRCVMNLVELQRAPRALRAAGGLLGGVLLLAPPPPRPPGAGGGGAPPHLLPGGGAPSPDRGRGPPPPPPPPPPPAPQQRRTLPPPP